MQGVSFQSTPSLATGTEHGGDWGWLVYGMIAFAACLHHGELTDARWLAALEEEEGTYPRCDSSPIILRECFPTATSKESSAPANLSTTEPTPSSPPSEHYRT